MKKDRPPCCPRCGYDQSGSVATWDGACPVRGLCSECGLEFAWVNVMRPGRDRVPGFVEHAWGKRQWAWWVVRTAWLAARPWSFWSRVKMHMEPRGWRAAGWVVAVCVGMWAIRAVVNSGLVLVESQLLGTAYQRAASLGDPLWFYVLVEWTLPIGSGFYNRTAGTPVWVWSIPWTWTYREQWTLLLAAVIWPVSFLLLPQTRRAAKVRRAHVWRAFAFSWAWLLILDLEWALGLPHRTIQDVAIAAGWHSGRRFHTWLGDASSAVGEWQHAEGLWFIVPVWLWLWLWWWMAIGRGFKMPHALGVALALGAINAMLTALVWAATWIVRVMA